MPIGLHRQQQPDWTVTKHYFCLADLFGPLQHKLFGDAAAFASFCTLSLFQVVSPCIYQHHSQKALTCCYDSLCCLRPDQMTKNKGSLSPMRGPLKLLYIELPRWPPLLPFTGGVAHGVSAVLTGIQAERSEGLCAHCRSLGGHAVPHTDCHRERMLPQDCQGTQSRLPLPLACQNCRLPFVVAFQTCL